MGTQGENLRTEQGSDGASSEQVFLCKECCTPSIDCEWKHLLSFCILYESCVLYKIVIYSMEESVICAMRGTVEIAIQHKV